MQTEEQQKHAMRKELERLLKQHNRAKETMQAAQALIEYYERILGTQAGAKK